MNKRVMNLVNFVRGCEPRCPMDLYTPVVKQMEVNVKYGFENTFLLQYDAMMREDFASLFVENRSEKTELGVWLEMCRALMEKIGIPWRGRPGYDWDWYVDPGFLMAYEPKQREALIDEVFLKFKELFGEYPEVVGSWLLDAYSMNYMCEKYHIKAFCVCREQHSVDAYTLWGGYYSGGYYAAKTNMICPAQTAENQIEAPVFRMLGIDPIYAYEKQTGISGCCTLEPTWKSGQLSKTVDWYFRTYYENPCLSHSETTTGQENSFGWENFGKGYEMQAQKLDALQKKGVLSIEKLGDTGEAYKKAFAMTPPAALCATEDWLEQGNRSVWYNCINYRANIFVREGKAYFRDIQMFDERYSEKYLTRPAGTWDAIYDNLPVVDSYRYSKDEKICALCLADGAEIEKITEDENALCVTLRGENGASGVRFAEDHIAIITDVSLSYQIGTLDVSLSENCLHFIHNGFSYHVMVQGNVKKTETGFSIAPIGGKIVLQFIKE